jgi:hypothetical protein
MEDESAIHESRHAVRVLSPKSAQVLELVR